MNLAAAITLVSASCSALFALVWLRVSRAPGWSDTRWLAAMSGSAALYSLFALTQVMGVSDAWVRWGGQASLSVAALHCAAWLLFLEARHGERLSRLERLLTWTGGAVAVAALVPGAVYGPRLLTWSIGWANVTYRTPELQPWGLPVVLYFLGAMGALLVRAARRWRDGWSMRMPVVGASLLLVLGVHDALVNAALFAAPLLTDLGFLVVISGYGVLELRRLIHDAQRLEALSTRLGAEVAQRTAQLEETTRTLANAEKLASLGQLASGVAHEVNNPASVVLSNLRYLSTSVASWKEAPEDLHEALDDARAATERIAAVARDLSAAGKVSVRAIDSGNARCTLDDAIASVVREVRHSRPNTPEVLVTGDTGLTAAFDTALFEQVLGRVLTNAVMAVEGSAAARVEVSAKRSGGAITVSVEDDGPGVPPEVQPRLFELFFSTRAQGKGVGLGLPVALGLMRSHGGDLAFKGNSPTRFVLTMPVWAPADLPAR